MSFLKSSICMHTGKQADRHAFDNGKAEPLIAGCRDRKAARPGEGRKRILIQETVVADIMLEALILHGAGKFRPQVLTVAADQMQDDRRMIFHEMAHEFYEGLNPLVGRDAAHIEQVLALADKVSNRHDR